ncbi:MAG: hypothetical protein ACYTGV_16565 [Planctomycetota bacterium]
MRWHEVIAQIQDNAERAGFACMELVIALVRAMIALIKKIRAACTRKDGEGYLGNFPER